LSADRDELNFKLSNMNIQIDALNEELEKERNNSLQSVKSIEETTKLNDASKQENEAQWKALNENHENELRSLNNKLEQIHTEKISIEAEIESLVSFLKYCGYCEVLKRVIYIFILKRDELRQLQDLNQQLISDRDQLNTNISNMNTQIGELNKELEKEKDNSLELVKSMQETERSNQENEMRVLSSKLEQLNTEKISFESEIESLVRFFKYHGNDILTSI
jgi:predicted  nucleic acid-binding Zn-ribbon protein